MILIGIDGCWECEVCKSEKSNSTMITLATMLQDQVKWKPFGKKFMFRMAILTVSECLIHRYKNLNWISTLWRP